MSDRPRDIERGHLRLCRAGGGSVPAEPPLSPTLAPRSIVAGILLVAAIASFNLFYRLGSPAQPIWDENYYLTSTARYELGYASFASHPPLALMLIAAGDRLLGQNLHTDWARIAADKKIAGERVPDGFSYFGIRAASATFGVIAGILFFLLMTVITGSVTGGLLASSPFLFDTALIAQFRAAQLDSFQLCFAVAALLSLTLWQKRRRLVWLFAFGLAAGCATMVRANGLLLLAGTILPILDAVSARGRGGGAIRRLVTVCATVSVGALIAASLVFAVQFTVARKPMPASWAAARADAPFVTGAYRASIDGKTPFGPAALAAAIDGYRRFMANDVAGVGRSDRNASSPWLWPLGHRPIVYRWDSDGRTTAYVALVPNPVGWLLSVGGLIAAAVSVARRKPILGGPLTLTLLVIWSMLFASSLYLASIRVMYLYHYFIPLLIGWILAAAAISRADATKCFKTAGTAFGALLLLSFLALAPFALHQPLSDGGCATRSLLSSISLCEHATTPRE